MRPCKLRLDRAGFVLTGAAVPGAGAGKPPLEASLPGVFAIGDVRVGLGQAGRRRHRRGRRGGGGDPRRAGGRRRRPEAWPPRTRPAPSAASCALLARPVRTARGRRGVVLQPYRGYGSAERIFVIGRVFWQHTGGSIEAAEFRAIVRRIRRRPVRGARVRARFYGAELVVETDRDGYFRVEMAPGAPVPRDRSGTGWSSTLLAPRARRGAGPTSSSRPSGARIVVVSDIDDTVMHTGVANKAAMLWRLFVQDADEPHRASRRRRALPGAARGRRGRRVQPDALRLARALGHLRHARGLLPRTTTSRPARSSSCASGGSAGDRRCRAARPTTSAC